MNSAGSGVLKQVKVVVTWRDRSVTTKVFTTTNTPIQPPNKAAESFIKGLDIADVDTMRMSTEWSRIGETVPLRVTPQLFPIDG